MQTFHYQQQKLFAENCSVADIAEQFGTPLYIYSRQCLETNWQAFDQAFGNHPHLICFAVKSNPNLAVLNVLAKQGSGFDIVSQGELERVLVAGGEPQKIVFSGVAKSKDEIRRALEVGIRCFNVESEAELHRINQIAGEMGKVAPISLRVNPDVDAHTHPYISTGLKENKFGVSMSHALEVYKQAQQLPHIAIKGLDCHIGSQLTELQPFLDAIDRLTVLIDSLKQAGIELHHLDLGGGLGVTYSDETPPCPREYVAAILEKLAAYRHLEIVLEPGRAICAAAGILVTQVEYLKTGEDRRFAIVNTGMNDLIRPALYQAYMQISEVDQSLEREADEFDVVGPICETSDFLGKQRKLAIQAGDLIAVHTAGAYGASMASHYNSHPVACEVMVSGSNAYLIKQREALSDLWRLERVLP